MLRVHLNFYERSYRTVLNAEEDVAWREIRRDYEPLGRLLVSYAKKFHANPCCGRFLSLYTERRTNREPHLDRLGPRTCGLCSYRGRGPD